MKSLSSIHWTTWPSRTINSSQREGTITNKCVESLLIMHDPNYALSVSSLVFSSS